MKKNFIKSILVEVKNLYNIDQYFIQYKKETPLIDYFETIKADINYAFQKIKSEYERD